MQRMMMLGLCLLLWGCATKSLESRRTGQRSTYDSLSPEWRALVDQGKLAIKMPSNAVYIAWGKPSRVYSGDAGGRNITTWIYTTTSWDEYHFWNDNYYGYQHGLVSAPVLDVDYIPRVSVAAQVVFEEGVIRSWSRLSPHPVSRAMAQKKWSGR